MSLVDDRHSARPRGAAWTITFALAVAAILAVVACGVLPPDPPNGVEPGPVDHFDLVANVPVAGVQLEFDLHDGTSVFSMVPLQSDLIVRHVVRGNRVYVTWIGGTPVAGPQIRLALERTVQSSDPPVIVLAASYENAGGEDLGAAHLAWRTAGAPVSLEEPFQEGFAQRSADVPLQASFADHPLGDLDGNGVVDVRDALRLLDRLRGVGWSNEFERYHSDLDGDDLIDAADLEALLDKVVDPELPASLVVKPRTAFGFAELSGASPSPALVLIANQGRQAATASELDCELPDGVVADDRGGVEGQSVALELSLPSTNRIGWQPGFARCGGVADIRLGNFVAMVAGQSNASGFGQSVSGWPEVPTNSVRVFRNDYRWANAIEPLDSAVGQLDDVSIDKDAAYSFGTRLGTLLHASTGFVTYMIPVALGGSRVTPPSDPSRWWQPTDSSLDRNEYLFSSAIFRSNVSAGLQSNPVQGQAYPSEGGPVNVLLWYQGESDANSLTARLRFVSDTNIVMNAFDAHLEVPVVFVQLATHYDERTNRRQHAIAELQRRLETDSSDAIARDDFHMVVAFDLPRSDHIHLSAFGQRLLAERIELAIREHVFGEEVDGTGPRLRGIAWSGGETITVRTTRPLSADTLDPTLFTVFEGPPNGNIDSDQPGGYGTNTVSVDSVVRDPADPSNVRLTLTRAPTATPHLRYMGAPNVGPPEKDWSHEELWDVVRAGVIRSAAGIGAFDLGLPLPSFGPLQPF